MQTSRQHLQRQQRLLSTLLCSCTCTPPAASASAASSWRLARSAIRLGKSQRYQSSVAAAAASALPRASEEQHERVGMFQGPSKRPLESFFKHSFLDGKLQRTRLGKAPEDTTGISEATASLSDAAGKDSIDVLPTSRAALAVPPPMATPTSAWRAIDRPKSIRAQLSIYKQLAKGRLTAWIVLTSMAGYAMCPTDPAAAALAMEALVQDTFGAASLSSALSGGPSASISSVDSVSTLNTFRVTTLLATAAGTALCSTSANTFNQLIEIPYDAQMPRTAKRPLPSHLITPFHAFNFGTVTGLSGLALLYTVNPLVASLGLLNIVLYAGVYTPLKRLSVVNTWIGAIVGGIPPLMGWAACTNSLDPFSGQAGAWILAIILFAWQFPHFNALSWTIRSEYARGGYRMLSAVNPGMNGRVSLRWTVAGAAAAAVGAPLVGLTSWTVGLATLVPSGALGYYAYKFWRAGSQRSIQAARQYGVMKTIPGARAMDRDPRDPSARSLFFVSLIHLPMLLFMMMAGKFLEDWQERRKAASQAAIGADEPTMGLAGAA